MTRGGSRMLLRTVVPRPVRRSLQWTDLALQRSAQRWFERAMDVHTDGHAYLDSAGPGGADRAFYEGCHWLPLHRALRALRPGPSDVFVDLGCGKGQALLVAGRHRFGRVLGVELDPELTRLAGANIAQARARLRCPEVAVVTSDVLTWELPDDLSVVFLYCPFMGSVFTETMRRVFASYDRRPRPLRILYAYPWEHDWLVGSGRVVVADVVPAQWPAKPWWWRSGFALVTYRVVAAGAGGAGVPRLRRRLFRPPAAVRRWSGPNGHQYKLVRPGHETIYSRPEPGEGGLP